MSARRRVLPAVVAAFALLVGTVATAAPASAAADNTFFQMTGDAADYITGGSSFSYAPPTDTVAVQGTASYAQFAVSGSGDWQIWFRAPEGQTLTAGTTYRNAQRAAIASGATPGFDVFGQGRGCNAVLATYSVLEIATDPVTGDITNFAATFESHCDAAAPASRGAVYFHSSLPYAADATITLNGLAEAPLGTAVTLSGALTGGAGAIGGAALHVTRSAGNGVVDLPDAVTAADGSFSFPDVMQDGATTWTVSYAGSDTVQPLTTSHVMVVGKLPSTVTVLAPTAATRGVRYTVSGIARRYGVRVNTGRVILARTDLSGTVRYSLLTNASGVYAFRDVAAVGGPVTWTATYAGDTLTLPSSAKGVVSVSRAATSVTARTSAASYAYGARAVVTIHLGTTYNRRDVYVYARPLAPGGPAAPGTLIARVRVNALGNAVVGYTIRSRTTFTVRFVGDYRYNAAARAVTANVVSKVTLQIGGSGVVSGGVYYVSSRPGAFRATASPLRTSGCMAFQVQRLVGSSWVSAASACFAYDRDHWSYVEFTPAATRIRYRIRAYVASNAYSLGGVSPWVTFTFV